MSKFTFKILDSSTALLVSGTSSSSNGLNVRMYYTATDTLVIQQSLNGLSVVELMIRDVDVDGLIEFLQAAKKEKEVYKVYEKLKGY